MGILDAQRDWGHAREYVRAMWLMLQEDEPSDYVVATGEQHTVQEFAEAAFSHPGLDYRQHVVVDPKLMRPSEVETLLGDSSKAYRKLGWSRQVRFNDLVEEMVEEDMRQLRALGQGKP